MERRRPGAREAGLSFKSR